MSLRDEKLKDVDLSLGDVQKSQTPVSAPEEVENHHCSKCGWERLLWRPQDKCAHVLICPLCLMTRPHSSQECDRYTSIRIEKLEARWEKLKDWVTKADYSAQEFGYVDVIKKIAEFEKEPT